MNYDQFSRLINRTVFSDSKVKLLQSIARQPENFVGLFRPTTPEVKIAQNLSQSHEIKFGYAFEELVRLYLKENGCQIFDSSIVIDGKRKDLDIYFRKDGKDYLVEQKTRDNHDSTKKRGQADDFEKKLVAVSDGGKKAVCGVLFFLDPGMSKNKIFYEERLPEITQRHGLETRLVYGGEFFNMLSLDVWDEIEKYLIRWRAELPGFPEFNYDRNPEESFNEIKDMSPADFCKIFTHEEIGKHILPILFPEQKTLKMLVDYWACKPEGVRARKSDGVRISRLINERISEMLRAAGTKK